MECACACVLRVVENFVVAYLRYMHRPRDKIKISPLRRLGQLARNNRDGTGCISCERHIQCFLTCHEMTNRASKPHRYILVTPRHFVKTEMASVGTFVPP